MSTRSEDFIHPMNGYREETWEGFNFPALFLGIFWLLYKRLYVHAAITFVAIIFFYSFFPMIGFIPLILIWIFIAGSGNGMHKQNLISKGYIPAGTPRNRYDNSHLVLGNPWKAQSENSNSEQTSHNNTAQETTNDNYTKLKQLAELRESGILTEDEFTKEKRKILGD